MSSAGSEEGGTGKRQRLPKSKRQPKAVADKQLTARSLEIIAAIARYRLLPTSLVVRLIKGNEDVTHRHLQQLFHKGLINRFAFPKTGGSNEFNYYLDSPAALTLLVAGGYAEKTDFDFEGVQRNKEKAYHKISDAPHDSGGRMLFLHHELMISRFHFMLELGCRNCEGKVDLAAWKQGPELHDSVTDLATGEAMPHRPDAFFTLHFPDDPEGRNRANFFYEADRKTTSVPKMVKKLQAHFEFIRQKKHQSSYGIKRIRAVLIETLDTKWAEELRRASAAICAAPLFWLTASEIFTVEQKAENNAARKLPLFLLRPEIVLQKVWALTTTDVPAGLTE